jgi:hypothetical protein
MSPLMNVSLVGLSLLFMVAVQASPLLETSNQSDDISSSKHNPELYELYKMMRTDPRLASVTNNDLVLYIYKNFASNQNENMMDLIKQKYQQQQQQQQLLQRREQ